MFIGLSGQGRINGDSTEGRSAGSGLELEMRVHDCRNSSASVERGFGPDSRRAKDRQNTEKTEND
jgi:hypothetical protein